MRGIGNASHSVLQSIDSTMVYKRCALVRIRRQIAPQVLRKSFQYQSRTRSIGGSAIDKYTYYYYYSRSALQESVFQSTIGFYITLLSILQVILDSVLRFLQAINLLAPIPSYQGSFIGAGTPEPSTGAPSRDSSQPAHGTPPILSNSQVQRVVVPTIAFLLPALLSPGAPYFKGQNVTKFLRTYQSLCRNHHVTEEQCFAQLPNYCNLSISKQLKRLPKFKFYNQDDLAAVLRKEYTNQDLYQQ